MKAPMEVTAYISLWNNYNLSFIVMQQDRERLVCVWQDPERNNDSDTGRKFINVHGDRVFTSTAVRTSYLTHIFRRFSQLEGFS